MIALQDGKFKPKNVNGAFINFIKKKCDIKTIENTSKKAETVGAKETKNPNANLTPEPLCNNDIEEKKTPEKRDVLLAKLEALTKKLGW
jgi:translation initiation factor 6 (eIF-6)